MNTIGRHLIAEFYGCDPSVLNNVESIREGMLAAAEVVGATVVGETFHAFTPQGVSGTVVIAESHLSIHTWPENGYVATDIYTCGGLNPHAGLELLGRHLKARSYRLQEILRGLPEELRAGHTLTPEEVQIISEVAPVVQLAEQVS